jgi:hypothetical protein
VKGEGRETAIYQAGDTATATGQDKKRRRHKASTFNSVRKLCENNNTGGRRKDVIQGEPSTAAQYATTA